MEKKAKNAEAIDDQDHDRLPYRLVLTCPSGLSPSQVSVVFDQAFDRIPHPDINLENSISEYGGHDLNSEGDSNQKHHVCLHIGLTDYRTFVGTNLSLLWEKFLVPSEDDCRQCQHTSNPLGNGAIVETSDKRILVLQRSHNVGEFPGHYVFPGGHPEPEEIAIASHQCGKDKNNTELINRKISQEMFDSIIREVVEEIGVPATSLKMYENEKRTRMGLDSLLLFYLVFSANVKCFPVFIGVSRRVLNVRPAAFFFIKCSLPSKEIQQLYSSAQDGYESTQLYTVSMNDLENMASKMPGCHQGGFALYKLMVEEMKDK
ncbi:hypothetical protein TEA_030112 [Camellia sinensis var. sinensis]|uniref:Nudix hydrolase domain-containing protein n=1 Tax=Camellia sinensis var. sinensis TaxID=542762 RepID=A0A4S4DRW2_CAMSN|nr:hypothetical protein TEA_030112 [Camellia sinensis var. sinensis]